MLVEGGYLHSMKLVIEKAAQTPDPPERPTGPGGPPRKTKGPGFLVRSLKRLGTILLGRTTGS